MKNNDSPRAKSGAEATAVQTLRDGGAASNFAERLDCGAFTAAFIYFFEVSFFSRLVAMTEAKMAVVRIPAMTSSETGVEIST